MTDPASQIHKITVHLKDEPAFLADVLDGALASPGAELYPTEVS